MNSQVRHMLHTRSLAFRSGDEMEYKSSKYKLRKTIKEAKQLYQQKLEGYYSTDARRMWQGLQLVTDYKGTTVGISNNSTSLPDELNQFYCHFETHNRETERTHAHTWDRHDPPPSVSSADVHRALRRVNPRKAAGPDNIPGRVLRVCASELADVFTSIFHLCGPQSQPALNPPPSSQSPRGVQSPQ
ncbi:hypothetical protein L3Q82_003409 [Scortum barcoo]|uniref:Uncharacterized protein n=1 Tax=Scortum barcoo TaxID=214431 RepID=A0ACB8VMV3_9TELE|nr:hypothetical protein L3Q82_003409 [Scortum barcoo]